MTDIIKIPGTNLNIVKKFYDKVFESRSEKVIVIVRPDIEEERDLTHYIVVSDIEKYGKIITKLGGKIIMEKSAVSRMGYFLEAQDPEGHFFGLWEENEDAEP